MARPKRRNNKKVPYAKKRNCDSIIMKGNETFVTIASSGTSSNTPINGNSTNIPIKPSTLSNRIIQVSDAFARYRLKYVKVLYRSHCATTTQGAIAFGMVDDADNTDNSGNINNYNAVTNLRTNRDGNLWKSMGFTWKPVDPKKWYYTDTAGEDIRFTQPCTLIAYFDANRTDNLLLGDIRLEYLIEFEGGKPVFVNNLVKAPGQIENGKEKVDEEEPTELRVRGRDLGVRTIALAHVSNCILAGQPCSELCKERFNSYYVSQL